MLSETTLHHPDHSPRSCWFYTRDWACQDVPDGAETGTAAIFLSRTQECRVPATDLTDDRRSDQPLA